MWIPFMLEFCLCSLSNSASYVQWIANEKYWYASSLPFGGLVKAFFMKFFCKMLRLMNTSIETEFLDVKGYETYEHV